MGNAESSPDHRRHHGHGNSNRKETNLPSFPGSAIVEALNCGNLEDALYGVDDNHHNMDDTNTPHSSTSKSTNRKALSQFFSRMTKEGELCVMSPTGSEIGGGNTEFDEEYEEFRPRNAGSNAAEEQHPNPQQKSSTTSVSHPITDDTSSGSEQDASAHSAALFAKALVSEVTDNPKTMPPAAMAEREKRLLKAQEKARQHHKQQHLHGGDKSNLMKGPRPVGAPGGVGQPSVFGSIAHVLTNGISSNGAISQQAEDGGPPSSVLPPNMLSENRAAQEYSNQQQEHLANGIGGKYTVTIGLSLSRRSSVGHPDTVTRQTAFDFNELQDREYKYVSSTDSSGWRAGGGECGGPPDNASSCGKSVVSEGRNHETAPTGASSFNHPNTPNGQEHFKIAAPDTVHIPIIHIDAESPQAVDAIISALASGEVFIPHMAIIPEALSVNGVSPPDLVVRFGTERNEDLPPDEWPNWCLEFMHNQLYEYFHGLGARWMKRPFSITLAKKVRWKTVKHMNRYFAHAERVIDAWREKGPQYLDPQLAYIEGGATPEEVARPHGIYLLRNGVPTNYFAPNFDPPYTTKMTRSLLLNVLGKSWDKKRREWTSQPIPKLVTPTMLVTAMFGCGENEAGGFVATEATLVDPSRGSEATILPEEAAIRSATPRDNPKKEKKTPKSKRAPPPVLANTPRPESEVSSRYPPTYTPSSARSRKSRAGSADAYEEDRILATGPTDGKERNPIEPPAENSGEDVPMEYSAPNDDSGDQAPETGSLNKMDPPTPPSPEETDFSPNTEGTALDPSNDEQRWQEEQENANPAEGSEHMSSNNASSSDIVQPSVTGTNSTILHMNLSAEKFLKQQLNHSVSDEKKEDPSTMVSDEDWLDEMGKLKITPKNIPSTPGSEVETMQSLEKERQRQTELLALAKERTSTNIQTSATDKKLYVLASAMLEEALSPGTKKSSPSFRGSNHSRGTSDPRTPTMRMTNSTSISRPKSPTSLRKNDSGTSGISLEYSVDSALAGENSVSASTFASTTGGSTVGSSLLGQNYAADGSIISHGTRENKNKDNVIRDVVQEDSHDSHNSSFSSSGSGDELIPTDEELFAVGWAKAFDPKSGSYYYFTLDRTQTVWENPLAPPDVSESQTEEESLQGANPTRAAAI